jgi:anti-sigma factor RsiW
MRTTRQHPSDEDLVAFLDGELPSTRRPGVESHLHACPRCESRSADMRAALTRVTAHLQASVDADRRDQRDQRDRLRRALRDLSAVPAPSTPTIFGNPVGAPLSSLQVVAVLLLAVVGIWVSARSPGLGREPRGRSQALTAASVVTLPLPSATPGAVSAHSASELCAGARPSRFVTDQTRRHVLARYGMMHVSPDEYELDALITPELGGTTDAANLWPQRYDSPVWNARVKDDLERLLPELVCRGELDLATAQQAIATDWITAYKRFFKTEAPLIAHGDPPDDDDELVLLPASFSLH